MAQHNAIKFFEAKKVRTVWDDIEEKSLLSKEIFSDMI